MFFHFGDPSPPPAFVKIKPKQFAATRLNYKLLFV